MLDTSGVPHGIIVDPMAKHHGSHYMAFTWVELHHWPGITATWYPRIRGNIWGTSGVPHVQWGSAT